MIYRKQTKPSAKHPLLLGVSGKARSGKTTAAEYIVNKHGGVKLAFADTLKAEVYDLNAIRGSELDGFLKFSLSNDVDIDFHALPRANMNNPRRQDKIYWINRFKDEFRTVLQTYGDYKRSIDPDYFIARTQKAIEDAIGAGSCVVVVDDVRYRNEAKALEDVGFEIVRVQASIEALASRGGDAYASHESETQLDSYCHSFIVFNNLEPHDMYRQLDDVVISAINR